MEFPERLTCPQQFKEGSKHSAVIVSHSSNLCAEGGPPTQRVSNTFLRPVNHQLVLHFHAVRAALWKTHKDSA